MLDCKCGYGATDINNTTTIYKFFNNRNLRTKEEATKIVLLWSKKFASNLVISK